MPELTSKKIAWLFFASLFLITLTSQYPIETSFPIGGDAARIIARSQDVKETLKANTKHGLWLLFTNSNYPVTTIIVAASEITPFNWPTRFIGLMVVGHILTGIGIGYIITKTHNAKIGALSIATWAIAAFSLTLHIQDGTLAQLLSFPFLLLTLDRWNNKKPIIGLILLCVTYLLHPLTAAIAIATGLWALLMYPPRIKKVSTTLRIMTISTIIGAAIVAVIFTKRIISIAIQQPASEEGISLHDLIISPAGPLIILAPLGYLLIHKKNNPTLRWILPFNLLSTLLIFHPHILGASIFLSRFQSYFAISIALLTGPAIEHIVSSLFPQKKVMPFIVVTLLFLGLGIQTWQYNIPMYNLFESPAGYERTHITEREGFEWMRDNLPENSHIATTEINRHSEWIPVLTEHSWVGLPESDPIFTTPSEDILNILEKVPYTHVVFLLKRENPQKTMKSFDSFTQIYSNEGIVIIDLSTYVP